MLGGGLLHAFEDPSLPLEVEIGPGDDDFLLEQAAAHPHRNWLGIEYSRKRVRRATCVGSSGAWVRPATCACSGARPRTSSRGS